MQNKTLESSGNNGKKISSKQEVDYSSKTYTRREEIISGLKMIAVFGIILILLLLCGKYM